MSNTTAAESVVTLDDVSRTYIMGEEKVHALRDVSIDFERGSFWAIMGQSGSGKSTLLNILGCLDRPTSGKYIINGNNVANTDDDALSEIRLRNLGFVFQSFHLIPQLTVQENIELPLYYLGWDIERSQKRSVELAEMVGLEDRLSHRPTELSGGQQQRVAIARSLANDPAILLADEPTGNLDSSTGMQIIKLLEELNDEGKTIIMVTHTPEIAAHSNRQLHLHDGRISKII